MPKWLQYHTREGLSGPKKVKLIMEMVGEQSNAKADKLESQGAVARLLAEEKKDIPWQSVIFAVP